MNKSVTILSFCIPTYNRAGRVYELVKEMLSYPHNDIEIIVLDNNSTDYTIEKLSSIKDTRLKLHSNNCSVPPIENWVKALSYGQGKYLFHLNDRDRINVAEIPELIRFLKDGIFSFIWCKQLREGRKVDIHEKGMSSLKKISFSGYHPTGLIFSKEMMGKLDLKNYTTFERVNILPHNFIIFDISFFEKTAFYYSNIWKYAEADFISKSVSGFKNGKNDSAKWYEPEARMKQLIIQIEKILACEMINYENKLILISIAFNKMLEASVIEYHYYCTDEVQCYHNGVKIKKFKVFELESIMLKFYAEFCRYLRRNKLITTKFKLTSFKKMLDIELKLVKIRIKRVINLV